MFVEIHLYDATVSMFKKEAHDFDYEKKTDFFMLFVGNECVRFIEVTILASSVNILVGKKIRTVITFIVANIKVFSCYKSFQYQSCVGFRKNYFNGILTLVKFI